VPAGTHVTGLREVVKALTDAGVEVEDLKEAMGAIAARAAEIAAAAAPSRSGKLRASIRGNKAKGKAIVTAGRASVPYAGAINYGWPARGIKPRKFMQQADAEIGPKAVELLEANINKILTEKGLTS
jgi:hypothetical protein